MRFSALIALGGAFFGLLPLHLSAGTVTLAWDPSPDPGIANYNIYYGGATLTYTNSLSAGTALSCAVSNLTAGAIYFFAATAVDTNGIESDFSTEVSATVTLPNQPPTLNPVPDLTINENAGTQTVNLSGITSGAVNESQTLGVSATSSNPALVPIPLVTYANPNTTGSIRFAPVAFGFGSATITITVNDGAAYNNVVSRSFTVTVLPVNQAPTLSPLPNLTINQNAGTQTVALSGISSGATNESQVLTVTAASSNPALIPSPQITYRSPNSTGLLSFAPASGAFGSAVVTVAVNDGGTGNNVVSRTFSVSVNGLPTISPITNYVLAVSTNSPPIPFSVSDPESSATSLVVSATSDNTGLVPLSGIVLSGSGGNRFVTVTPVSAQTGNANIALTVSDGLANAQTTFRLTVRQRPSSPGRLRLVAGP